MKLKQRMWLSLVGIFLCLGILTVHLAVVDLSPGWISSSVVSGYGKMEHDLRKLERADRLNLGRNLNMASSENLKSRDVSFLLSVIAALKHYNNSAEDSRQILENVLNDKNLSNAFINFGNILGSYREKQRSLTKEVLPQFAPEPGGRQDTILRDVQIGASLNNQSDDIKYDIPGDNVVKELQGILHKLGYSHRKVNRVSHQILSIYKNLRITKDSPSFRRFQQRINKYELYSSEGSLVDELLSDITSLPFIQMAQKTGGTQLKLTFYFKDRSQAIFKPMRFPREQETLPNHFYFSDYERHNAEIAAFHLDRLLDFRRVPPVAGRVVNVTQDIWRYADGKLEKTFFISPAGNVCFHGHCDYYCDTGHAICGHPELLEGSFVTYLPSPDVAPRSRWRHPWRRSYHKRKKAKWETDYRYCDDVKMTPPYDRGRRLLDLMDMSVFDFLTGNMDRHHYETFSEFDNDTFPILFDNGRSFGKASHDEMSILAPVYQCCLIRASTLHKLLSFQSGSTSLSQSMKASLSRDPIDPILTAGHLEALDRRLGLILVVINECIIGNPGGYREVVIDDGF